VITTPTEILVATDFGQASDAALTYGRMLARTYGASLHILHVVENVFLRAMTADPRNIEALALRQLNERLIDDDRTAHRARVVETSDDAAESILAYARREHISLVVMGTHGRRGMERVLMGSVAERVIRAAPCPVLTVRHAQPTPAVTAPSTSDTRQITIDSA
jgi:nucleotide-binding universal stress UspA family protein